jgi:hypothetical protein
MLVPAVLKEPKEEKNLLVVVCILSSNKNYLQNYEDKKFRWLTLLNTWYTLDKDLGKLPKGGKQNAIRIACRIIETLIIKIFVKYGW